MTPDFMLPGTKPHSKERKLLNAHIRKELIAGRNMMELVYELVNLGHNYDNIYSSVKHQANYLKFKEFNDNGEEEENFKPGWREDGTYEFAPGHVAEAESWRLIEQSRSRRKK